MQRSGKDVLYFETGPDNEPTMWVEPGEEFEVVTQMNRGPWLDDHPDGERLREVLRAGNPSSGCIYVNGAEPGMALVVHVGEIEDRAVRLHELPWQHGGDAGLDGR